MSTNDPQRPDLEPGERYGTTNALTRNGGLKRNQLNEFAEVHDEQAVVQDQKVALLTPKGTDPLDPEYGIQLLRDDESGLQGAIGTSDAAFRLAVLDAIGPEADPRVESIDRIEINRVDGDRDNVEVVITETLVDGVRTSFEFSPQFTPR